MESEHTITSKDKWFLDKHMKDPIAQEPFKVGDTIVICAKCKTAQYDVSWNMNSNKCCSLGCGHDHKLRFETFAVELFQPKVICNPSFKIIEEKILFREVLKVFYACPMRATVIALLPILVALFLFRSALYPAISVVDGNEKLLVIQEKFIEMGDNSYSKSIHSIEKVLSIEADFGDLKHRTDIPMLSLDDIAENIEEANFTDKLHKVFFNVSSIFKRAEEKFLSLSMQLLRMLSGG